MYEASGDFLKEEVRDDFEISSLMKSAWAAELKTLDALQTLCGKHGLTCYAAFGTLLGAARHRGFVPWDDDIDVAMPRSDYMKFLSVSSEMPAPFRVKSIYTQDVFTQFHSVVTNSRDTKLNWDEDRIRDFFGCPFIVGIDVYALDYIPADKNRQDLQRLVYTMGYHLTGQMEAVFREPYTVTLKQISDNTEAVLKTDGKNSQISVNSVKKLEDFLKELTSFGRYLNTGFDESGSLFMQLMKITDQVASNCSREDAGYRDFFHHLANLGENCFVMFRKLEWYNSAVELPFENITVTVPSGYKEILATQYGNWQIPVKGASRHGYPFYKSQEEYFRFIGKM